MTNALVHLDNGLLSPGPHRVSLQDVEAGLVVADFGDVLHRRAVYAGLLAWLQHARYLLGPGTAFIGGGFVSKTEPEDTALAGFEPHDRDLARTVARTDAALDLQNLSGVLYETPTPGGSLRLRWSVSGLVDAYLIDESTRRTYLTGFAAVLGADRMPLQGVTKGYVEVGVP